jgi:hypothetical protein
METIPFYINNLGPAIVRRLSSNTTGTFDIQPGQTFHLKVRARDSSTVLLDKPMVADTSADTLTYQPVSGDTPFMQEGVYRAWVYYVNAQQDTDEFEILVLNHAPGEGTRTGTVWRAARAMAPVAWDALRSHNEYGDLELQRLIDLAKLRVLRSSVPVADEASLDPRVVDYIARKVLVDHVLEAAIDYWTNVVTSRTARGSDEVETYPDRISAHVKMLERFMTRLAEQSNEVSDVLGDPTGPLQRAPALSSTGPLITPGLESFPLPYRELGPSEDPTRWR